MRVNKSIKKAAIEKLLRKKYEPKIIDLRDRILKQITENIIKESDAIDISLDRAGYAANEWLNSHSIVHVFNLPSNETNFFHQLSWKIWGGSVHGVWEQFTLKQRVFVNMRKRYRVELEAPENFVKEFSELKKEINGIYQDLSVACDACKTLNQLKENMPFLVDYLDIPDAKKTDVLPVQFFNDLALKVNAK